MQLFGATYTMWIERLMAGISHQHVLSYNPNGSCDSRDSRLNLELLFIDGQNLIFYNKSNIALKYVVVNMREESRRVLL